MGCTHDAPRSAVLARREHLHEPHCQRCTWVAARGDSAVRLERTEASVDRACQLGHGDDS